MNKGLCLFCLLFITTQSFAKVEEAIFAGGNFWTMQQEFSEIPGVLRIVVGFDGDCPKNPTLAALKDKTNCRQAIRVIYNPKQVSYQQLVMKFWQWIDPSNPNGQFCDHGVLYRSAIFYQNSKQKQIAKTSKQILKHSFKQIYTDILPSTQFYAAEEIHQDYAQKNPLRYHWYRYWCGRKVQLKKIWSR